MLNLDCLGKDLGIVSPPDFVYDVSTKMLLKLYIFWNLWELSGKK